MRKNAFLTVNAIKQKTGNTNVDYICTDLSDLSQVRNLATQLKDNYPRIDVLLNNAGAFFEKRLETVDGYEVTFALNYLSPFLLTTLLIDNLKESSQGRIINVSSSAHFKGEINFEDLQLKNNYHAIPAYAQSKLALMLFSNQLAENLKDTNITVNALHPGEVETNFRKNNGWLKFYIMRILKRLLKRNGLSPLEGSKTMTYLAVSPELAGITGRYFVKEKQVKPSDSSSDKKLAKQLWEAGETMINS